MRLVVERNDHAVRVAAQNGRRKQRRHVHAADLARRTTTTVTRDRRPHRTRHVQTNDDWTWYLRYVATRNLSCLAQRNLDLLRQSVLGVQVSRQVLVRELI